MSRTSKDEFASLLICLAKDNSLKTMRVIVRELLKYPDIYGRSIFHEQKGVFGKMISPLEQSIKSKSYEFLQEFFIPCFKEESVLNEQQKEVVEKCIALLNKDKQYEIVQKLLPLLTNIPKPERKISLPEEEESEDEGKEGHEEKKVDKEKECVICIKREKNTVTIPCGHSYSCVNCMRDYVLNHSGKTCAICKKEITQVVKLFG